jgi:excisionase family DNA binding protein
MTVIGIDDDELDRRIEAALRRVLGEREPAPEWLDAKGAAALLGVHEKTVQRMVRSQGLPCHQIGPRLYRYSRAELESWFQKRKTSR